MKLLKDLVLALLNATMLLLIALVISVILLINKAADFRDQTAAVLAPQAAQLERAVTALEALNDGTQSAQTEHAIKQTLDRIPDLSYLEQLTITEVVQEVLRALGEWLSHAQFAEKTDGTGQQ